MRYPRGYQIVGQSKIYPRSSAAQHAMERKNPGIIWGKWHQGPTGRVEIVGKIPGREADDPIVVRKVS